MLKRKSLLSCLCAPFEFIPKNLFGYNFAFLLISLVLFSSFAVRAGDVSLSFRVGYIGIVGNNTGKADNIKTFTTLGISRVSFIQNDANGDGKFGDAGTQGNDLAGTIKFYLNSGQTFSVPGALNWREGTTEVYGIIFDAGVNQSFTYGNNLTYTIRGGTTNGTSSNLGLRLYASTVSFTDGENRAGNAATSGLLQSLNDELLTLSPQPSSIQLTSPSVVEGNNLVYTVALSFATAVNVPQVYTFSKAGTATASSDYTPTFTFSNGVTDNGDGTITVPGGVSSFTITVNTINDTTPEDTETLVLNVGSKSGTGSITDNDVSLSTSVASLTAFSTCTNTASSAQSFTFSGNIYSGTVTVTAPAGFEISQTQNGTYSASIAYSFAGTSVAATTVWVRSKSTATNGLSGNVTVATAGGTTQNVSVSVTVNTIPTISISPSSATIALGGSVTLTASGGTTYSWSPSTNLSASNTVSVTASPSSTISYTVTGTSAAGCSATASVTITVNPALTAGSIAASQTICVGATPAAFTSSSAASGGVGTINYQWETSTDNSTWSNVVNATSATYSPGAISVNTYFRRKASTSTDAPVYTSAVLITVQQSVGGTIAGSATVCSGTNSTVLTLSGQTGSITKWQSSLYSNFSSVTDIVSSNASITATNLTATTYYRAVVTLGSCTSANSSVASVTVNALPTITVNVIPDVTTSATSFTIPYTNLSSGADKYSLSTGTIAMPGFTSVNNASITASPLTISIPASTQNSYDFNLTILNNTTGCSIQRGFNLVVTDINPGTTGSDQSICYGTTPAPFTSNSAASGGGGSPTYIWQISTSGITGTYTDIAGATAATYTHPTALTGDTYFRRKATIGASVATAHPIEVLVNALPVISVSPSSASITTGSSVSLTASGANTYSWTPSAGLSATNTAVVTASPTSTTTYTVTGTNSTTTCSSTASVTVTVNPALTAGSISADQTICVGATPASLTSSSDATGGTGPISYIWESSIDGTTYNTISGATSSTYSPGAVSVNTYFKRGASTPVDAVVYSSPILITVQQSVGGSIAGSASVCTGTNTTVLTLSGHTGSITKWQSALASDFSGTVTDIASTTASITATNLTASTYYRAVITLGSCTAANSSVATVTVNALPVISVSPSSASITTGSSVSLTASGADSYSWTPSTGLSATNTAVVTASPTSTTTYTVTGTNSTTTCSSTASVTVTVNAALAAGSISADQTICVGATPAALTSSSNATGGTGPISYVWQSSTDGTIYNTISGATSSTYSPGAIFVNTYFKRGASTPVDAVVYSSPVLITVQQSVGGSIAGSASVCTGTNSTVLTLSGHTGSITKWQSALASDFSGTVTDIASTTASITATNLTATTYYRAVITLGSCTSVNSSIATVTVNALPVISVSPSVPSIANGSSVTLTASGSNTYSWTPSTGLSATNTAVVTASPTVTTTYTITGTSNTSCSTTTSVTVTVTSAASADSDGDGVTDTQEIADGTDPNDGCSYLAASKTLTPSSAWNALDCDGDGTPNGTDTDPKDPCVHAAGATPVYTNAIWRAADCDGDGVTNGKEKDDNTDPNDGCSYLASSKTLTPSAAWNALDCDGDGTPNGTDTDPKDPCVHAAGATPVYTNAIWRAADCDGDGVTNGKEKDDNTDPNDGCSYLAASKTLTPSAAWNAIDCDGDGTPNGTDTDPKDPCVHAAGATPVTTNAIWRAADCDGDGVTNGKEKDDNTDPNDGCSYLAASKTLTPSTAWNALDCDGDGTPNGTDTDPKDPCVHAAGATPVYTNAIWRAADCDGDGVTNGKEKDDNTDPNDGCSYLAASKTLTPSTAWNGLDCDGDGTPNGTDSDPKDPCVHAAGATPVYTNAIWRAADCDGDGVTNGKEKDDNTDPNNGCSFVAASKTLTPTSNWGALDCDGDGNPNATDPNKDTPVASNDAVTVGNSGKATINLLSNDDFLPGANTEIVRQVPPNEGTAKGTVTFNPLTGEMTYKRAPFESGLVTMGYKVTNKGVNPPVSATAFVTIVACDLQDPLADCDGDGDPNGTDTAPTDPCVYSTTLQVKANVSDDWKALDCDGDGVINGTELTDGTSPADGCSFKAPSITLAPSAAWLLLDCDADGITNKVEGTQDFDGDGIPNCLDTDSDGDSISDKLETTVDTDKDGKPDYLDLDSDNDGILDSVENRVCTGTGILCDTDADGKPNFRDLDSDADQISDVIEANGSDYNKDGIADGNIDEKGIPTSANKGLTPPDTDRDGKLDPYDVDSDGDGILDYDEEYNEDADFPDCDKDGIINRLDPDECDIFSPQGISPNGDGKNDRLVFKGLYLRKIPNHLSIYNRWGTLVYEMESYDNTFTGTLLPDGTYYYILDFFGKKPTISNYLSVDRTIK